MPIVIGMDEAGYGPNIGPLVTTASVWEIEGDPKLCDFWNLLTDAVTQVPSRDGRLRVADSKQVYSSSRGIVDLERSVLALLGLHGPLPQSFRETVERLGCDVSQFDQEPWFAGIDLPLPIEADSADIKRATEVLRSSLRAAKIRCRQIRSDVVLTSRFNQSVREFDNKAAALSRFHMRLLRAVWDPDQDPFALVIGDKHGARNRYDDLLIEAFDGRMPFRLEEGSLISRYRLGQSELRFQQKAESYFPVAVSSMVCKYLRELSLELFNQFWRKQLPDLAPTKGYPVDAKRFRKETEALRSQLGIPDETFWRER